jgi:hypothetical protein
MNRSDVTKAQAKKLSQGLYPVQNYLCRLRRRMEQVGFPPTDPLYALVDAACDAVHRLRIHVHYMSYDGVDPKPNRAGAVTAKASTATRGKRVRKKRGSSLSGARLLTERP